jgi:hypothetical protein
MFAFYLAFASHYSITPLKYFWQLALVPS